MLLSYRDKDEHTKIGEKCALSHHKCPDRMRGRRWYGGAGEEHGFLHCLLSSAGLTSSRGYSLVAQNSNVLEGSPVPEWDSPVV